MATPASIVGSDGNHLLGDSPYQRALSIVGTIAKSSAKPFALSVRQVVKEEIGSKGRKSHAPHEKPYRADEVSTFVLKKSRVVALGCHAQNAIITAPSSFTATRRQPTKDKDPARMDRAIQRHEELPR